MSIDLRIDTTVQISDDLELLARIEKHTNKAAVLVRESFSRRWCGRLKREGISAKDAWEVFLGWLREIMLLFRDMFNRVMGDGIRLKRKQVIFLNRFESMRDKLLNPYTGMVKIDSYSKAFIINDHFNPRACREIMKSLPSSLSDALKWAEKGVGESLSVLRLSTSVEGAHFDIVSEANVNNVTTEKDINFISRLGERSNRKFPRIGSGANSEEQQLIWALPGNTFVQYFSYNYFGEPSKPVTGIRFRPDFGKSLSPKILSGLEEITPLERIYTHVKEIEGVSDAMISIERSGRKLNQELNKLRKEVDKVSGGNGSTRTYKHKLAREALLSSTGSIRSLSVALNIIGEGVLKRATVHLTHHIEANKK